MKKQISLDKVRIIAAFMIVAIHIYPFSFISQSLDYAITRILFRIALPIFLMITGYFVLPLAKENSTSLKKYTKKILQIYFFSILIYLPINIYIGTFETQNLLSILKVIFVTGTMYHLWYFPALILGLWITYFLIKHLKNPSYTIIFLYIIGLFGDSYFGLIENFPILNTFYQIIFSIFDYSRNGFFYVPIFLYIGYHTNTKKSQTNFKQTVNFCILYLLLMLIEGIILFGFKIPRHTSMYFFLIPFSYNLFTILIENRGDSNKFLRTLGTLIYILHPASIIFVHKCANLTKFALLNNSLINYTTVLLVTTAISYIIIKLKEYFKHEKSKYNE